MKSTPSIVVVKLLRLDDFKERKHRPVKLNLENEASVHHLIKKANRLRSRKDT